MGDGFYFPFTLILNLISRAESCLHFPLNCNGGNLKVPKVFWFLFEQLEERMDALDKAVYELELKTKTARK